MFEDLKDRQRGFSNKEKARLYVTVAACLVLGAIVFGGRGCDDSATRARPTAKAKEAPAPKTVPFEMGPLAAFREKCPDPSTFDGPALTHVLAQVMGGRLHREPDLAVPGPSDVLALDCKDAVGKSIEVTGTIQKLEREEWKGTPGIDRLWSFALVGSDGKQIAFVHPGLSSNPDEDKPVDAYHPTSARETLENGVLVRARGIYLQQRTGSVGLVTLDGSTPVLVGKEYRRTVPSAPPIESLDKADWSNVKDRFLEDTRILDIHFEPDSPGSKEKKVVHEDAYYQLLAWIRAKGHDEIVKELKAGTLPSTYWGPGRFQHFASDLKNEVPASQPDPRADTNAYRGQIFYTTGLLGEFLKEDWDTVPVNFYDIGERYKLWLVSDFYGNAMIPFDGQFPLSVMKDVRPVKEGPTRQRVKVYGIFYKGHTYRPRGADQEKESAEREGRTPRKEEITVPAFLLLHVEPDDPIRMAPMYENPFFWIWMSLLGFGGVFFFVMAKIEKKEAGAMRDQNIRIKRRQREVEATKIEGSRREGAGGSGAGEETRGPRPLDPPSDPPP